MERPTLPARRGVERHALPVRLVAGFNKVKIKGIAKKTLSNHNFVTSKYNRGAAARRWVERHALLLLEKYIIWWYNKRRNT